MHVPSLWQDRDLKVLVAATELTTESDWSITAEAVADRCGLSKGDVCRSIRVLDGEYLEASNCPSLGERDYTIQSVTPKGLRLVGAWPSGDTATELIIAQLERIASSLEHPEEERSAAQKVLDVLKEVGTSTMAQAVSNVLIG